MARTFKARLIAGAVIAALGSGVVTAQTAGLPTGTSDISPIGPADEDTGQKGQISATLGYERHDGVSVAADSTIILGPERDRRLAFSGKVSRNRASAGLAYEIENGFFGRGDLFFGIKGRSGRPTSVHDFKYAAATALVGAAFGTDRSRTTGYAGLGFDRISDAGPQFPAIAAADLKTRHKLVIGLEHAFAAETSWGSWSIDLGAEAANLSEGGTILQLRYGGAVTGRAIGGHAVWSAELQGGTVTASGTTTSIGDRYFQGSSTLRGFAFGGFGPHDPVADVPVGGTRYAALRLDLRAPDVFGPESKLIPGVHYDIGSVWGLDATSTLDTAFHPRSSVGVTFLYEIGAGAVEVNLSKALDKRTTDKVDEVQVQFRHKF